MLGTSMEAYVRWSMGPTIDQTSEITENWNSTFHSVSSRHHPHGYRLGTLDVDSQVDILAVSPVDIVAMMLTEYT